MNITRMPSLHTEVAWLLFCLYEMRHNFQAGPARDMIHAYWHFREKFPWTKNEDFKLVPQADILELCDAVTKAEPVLGQADRSYEQYALISVRSIRRYLSE